MICSLDGLGFCALLSVPSGKVIRAIVSMDVTRCLGNRSIVCRLVTLDPLRTNLATKYFLISCNLGQIIRIAGLFGRSWTRCVTLCLHSRYSSFAISNPPEFAANTRTPKLCNQRENQQRRLYPPSSQRVEFAVSYGPSIGPAPSIMDTFFFVLRFHPNEP